jgi:copper transport protein
VLLRRTLRVEMALGAAVIVATAALASYAPASSVTGGPFSTDFDLGPARAEMTIDPAEVGANEMHLYFFRRDDGSQWNETRELRMAAALPAKEIPPIELDPRKAGPGHYVVSRAQFGVAGDWQVEIVSRVSEFEEHRAIVEVPVR